VARVRVGQSWERRTLDSATLPREACDALLEAVRPFTVPRRAMVAGVFDVMERWRVSRLVLAYCTPGRDLPDVEPANVPFEPLELDETHGAIQSFCEGLAATRPHASPPRAVAWRRVLLRAGLPLAAILPIVAIQLARVIQERSRLAVFVALITLLPLVTAALLLWWTQQRWFIVPGGVLVRGPTFGAFGGNVRLYTPDGTLLVLQPHAASGWQASLCHQERRVGSRRLTPLECAALLIAWRSALPPPEEPPDTFLTD
jgi:hypothetical protein